MKSPITYAPVKILIVTAVVAVATYFAVDALDADTLPPLLKSNAVMAALGVVVGALVVLFAYPRLSPAPSYYDEEGDQGASGDDRQSIFVGNLNFNASREQVQALFAEYGEVISVRIMTDRVTRRPRGFGFIEMPREAAFKAIDALNGQEFMGRDLRVNEGHDRRHYNHYS